MPPDQGLFKNVLPGPQNSEGILWIFQAFKAYFSAENFTESCSQRRKTLKFRSSPSRGGETQEALLTQFADHADLPLDRLVVGLDRMGETQVGEGVFWAQ